MSARTTYLSKLLGLILVVEALSMCFRKTAFIGMITQMSSDPSLLFVLGFFAVVAGLALVLSHNVWSGSPAAIIVTIIGWLILIRGIYLLFASGTDSVAKLLVALHFADLFYLYAAIVLVLGLYLSYAGFTSRDARQALSR